MAKKQNEMPRAGPRFSINLSVVFDRSSAQIQSESGGKGGTFEGTVENISSGGACLLTQDSLDISEVIKISFPIQGSISQFISPPRTLAEVKWTRPAVGGKFLSGIRFLL